MIGACAEEVLGAEREEMDRPADHDGFAWCG